MTFAAAPVAFAAVAFTRQTTRAHARPPLPVLSLASTVAPEHAPTRAGAEKTTAGATGSSGAATVAALAFATG